MSAAPSCRASRANVADAISIHNAVPPKMWNKTWNATVKKNQRKLGACEIMPHIRSHVPESTCEYCSPDGEGVEAIKGDAFDRDGYPLLQGTLMTSGRAAAPRDPVLEWQDAFNDAGASKQAFRFLVLPPELRNRIYEFAFTAPVQPICVRDGLLRPSKDLGLDLILRECSYTTVCLPCQLHRALKVANSGLSGVSQQLHAETALIPYAINTFSVHNLYYLQTFLELIGEKGRKQLKSIAFKWKAPEDEAYALRIVMSHWRAYRLLLDCTTLTTLELEVNSYNLLSRKCDGRYKDYLLDSLDAVPSIELLYELRGLQDVKFGWVRDASSEGMIEWAESWIKLWRLPRGSWEVTDIEESEKEVSVGEAVEYAHWRARGFERKDSSPAVQR